MNYESVVDDLFDRFPKIRADWETRLSYMGAEKPPYIVFGSILIPALEAALSAGNLGVILPICAFLEDVAEAAQNDSSLNSLLQIEVGEWLRRAANESLLSPWLGKQTVKICRYVPGLATQRLALQEERKRRTFKSRLSLFLERFHNK